MLKSVELTKKFGKKTAVDNISLELEKGHVYAMLGPNGSGKTTWMKMAAALMKPTSGKVFFKDAPVGPESRKHVAYMSTEPYFYPWMTVRDVGEYYSDFFEDFYRSKFRAYLNDMDLDEDLIVKTLSSGMMAKLKIAATISRDADVYMLDEPFNGIDLLARDDIRKAILTEAGENKLLLLSSHLVEEMEAVADRAVFIKHGRLVEVRSVTDMHLEDNISMADRYREIYGHTEDAAHE